jgi:hypothetical protein
MWINSITERSETSRCERRSICWCQVDAFGKCCWLGALSFDFVATGSLPKVQRGAGYTWQALHFANEFHIRCALPMQLFAVTDRSQ